MKKKLFSVLLILSVILVGAGCAGDIGPVGQEGSPGLQGDAGVQGVAGPQGLVGSQGGQGIVGPQGIRGATGSMGLQGEQGEQGEQGIQGEEGPRGSSGGGSTGPAGSTTTPVFMIELQVKTAEQALSLINNTQVDTAPYSVWLQTTGTAGTGDEARMVLTPYKPMTLGQISSISWREYLNAGYPPHVDIKVMKADGTLEAIVIEYAHNSPTHYAEAPMPYGAITGAWYSVFSDDSGGPPIVSDTSFGWAATGAAGPYPVTASLPVSSTTGLFIGDTLAQWKAGQVVTGVDGSSQVVNITIEIDNWMVQSDAYLDTVKINGTVAW